MLVSKLLGSRGWDRIVKRSHSRLRLTPALSSGRYVGYFCVGNCYFEGLDLQNRSLDVLENIGLTRISRDRSKASLWP